MQTILATARGLLVGASGEIERRGITLVGVTVSNLEHDIPRQLALALGRPGGEALDAAVDEIRERFGLDALTWAALVGRSTGLTVPLVPSRQQPDRLYTAAAAGPPPGWRQGANAALYRSDNGGEHWVRLEHGLPAPFDTMVRQIAVDDAETVFVAAGTELFASHNNGDSWQRLAGELPTVQALAVV